MALQDGRTDTWAAAAAAGRACLPAVPASIWSWVPRLDELSQCMSQRLVFWAWQEGHIAFPPSYRWERGAWAADFTDLEVLASSYTTAVAENAPTASSSSQHHAAGVDSPSHPHHPHHDSSSIRGGSSTSGSSSGGVAHGGSAGAALTPRTPSYTDRILTHSLPGRAGSLVWQHYDSVDCVTISDHRPVAASLALHVDRSVIVSAAEEERESHVTDERLDHDTTIYTLSLANLRLVGGSSGWPGSGPRELSVLFPLVSEDSLAFLRKASALEDVSRDQPASQAIGRQAGLLRPPGPALAGWASPPFTCLSDLAACPACHTWMDGWLHGCMQVMPGPRYGAPLVDAALLDNHKSYSWGSDVRMTVIAHRSRSRHVLLRVTDRKGSEVGQGVLALHPDQDLAPQQHDAAAPSSSSSSREVRVELTSGGAFRAMLLLQLSVRQSPLPDGLVRPSRRLLSSVSSQSSSGGAGGGKRRAGRTTTSHRKGSDASLDSL